MHIHWNTAAIIDDRDAVIRMDRDIHLIAVASQRLIDRVIDDLIDQMMQTALRRTADIHTRTLADGLEALQNLDLSGTIITFDSGNLGTLFIAMDLDIIKIQLKILKILFIRILILCFHVLRILHLHHFFHLYEMTGWSAASRSTTI